MLSVHRRLISPTSLSLTSVTFAAMVVGVALAACEKSEPQPAAPSAATPAPSPSPSPQPPPGSAAPAAGADAAAAGAPGSANPGINDRYRVEETREKAIKVFEGPERGALQTPKEVVGKLKIRPGNVVADVGAGSGYLTPELSKAVGAKGKVYAEDIIDPFLDKVRAKVKEHKLSNVETVLGTETDAKLPEACCDVAVVLDTYHHFEWPEPMMASIRKALKPGGRLYVIEFRRKQNPLFEASKIDYKTHIRLDEKEVVDQIVGFGWKHVETKDFPPYQYVAVFTPASKSP